MTDDLRDEFESLCARLEILPAPRHGDVYFSERTSDAYAIYKSAVRATALECARICKEEQITRYAMRTWDEVQGYNTACANNAEAIRARFGLDTKEGM